MEELDEGIKRLTIARDDHIRRLDSEMLKISVEEKRLRDKFHELDEKKRACAAANGNADASDDDLIEINAGGKIIAARRGVLRQLKETNLEALFSGRWERKLPKDSSGRIFLDVNGKCFQAIVDWLNLLAISSEDEPLKPPSVDKEYMPILNYQWELFNCDGNGIDSNIIKSNEAWTIHDWLDEDDIEGGMKLLYCSSRDGLSNKAFHEKCDNKGPTLVLFELTEGGVIGGYTNTSWANNGDYVSADKAFLFALSGFGITSPCKMKLKDTNGNAIERRADYGAIFGGNHGDDLFMRAKGKKSYINLSLGNTYCSGPSELMNENLRYDIKKIEVFQISEDNPNLLHQRKRKQNVNSKLSGEMGEAITQQWKTLSKLDAKILYREESSREEEQFIDSFSCGNASSDIVTLNVSGTIMATSRDTLQIAEDSMLAQQFDNTKWTEQSNAPKVKEWTPDDVANWVEGIEGVPDDVASLVGENNINGLELLSLDKEGLKMLGVQRVGTICLLYDEISKLEKEASQDVVTLIEHSPYCFGKILDYLRMKRFSSMGLGNEPAPPIVCEHKKEMFEKVVKYYFPGESSDPILGSPLLKQLVDLSAAVQPGTH